MKKTESDKIKDNLNEGDGAMLNPTNSLNARLPFNMRSFWLNINEKYFSYPNTFDTRLPDHLVHSFSKYGKI